MGIKEEIKSVNIRLEKGHEYNGSLAFSKVVGEENDMGHKISKIEISSAIFIYTYSPNTEVTTVDIIPFHHVKKCTAVLEESNVGYGSSA